MGVHVHVCLHRLIGTYTYMCMNLSICVCACICTCICRNMHPCVQECKPQVPQALSSITVQLFIWGRVCQSLGLPFSQLGWKPTKSPRDPLPFIFSLHNSAQSTPTYDMGTESALQVVELPPSISSLITVWGLTLQNDFFFCSLYLFDYFKLLSNGNLI